MSPSTPLEERAGEKLTRKEFSLFEPMNLDMYDQLGEILPLPFLRGEGYVFARWFLERRSFEI